MRTDRKDLSKVYANLESHREQCIQKGAKPIIGIDIGSKYIKIVQMKSNNKVAKMAIVSNPVGMINQGRIEVSSQLADIIRNACSKYKISGNECAICLSASELIVRELRFPEMNESQIMENIKHEITSFLPLNHDDYIIDYKVLEYTRAQDGSLGNIRIMVAAVPENLVQTYVNTFKMAKLKVSYVDVLPNIASKLVRHSVNTQAALKKDVCIIDFGANTTNIVVLKDGNYFIHKSIINGGEYLTSVLSEKLKKDVLEAEDYKIRNDLLNSNNPNNESQHVKNFIDYFMVDINKILEYFKIRNNQKGIDQIYITGGGSLINGLPMYMKEHIGINVTRLTEVLPQFRPDRYSEANLSFFLNAIGATIREE